MTKKKATPAPQAPAHPPCPTAGGTYRYRWVDGVAVAVSDDPAPTPAADPPPADVPTDTPPAELPGDDHAN